MANLFGIPKQHMENWGDALISKNPPWTTTPEYHQWGAQDVTQEKSKEIAQDYGNLAAGAFELAAPVMALGASPLYDIPQALWKYSEDPDKYTSPFMQNVKTAQENIDPSVKAALESKGVTGDYFGADFSGILRAINEEDPLSAAYNRMIGAGKPVYNRIMHAMRDKRATEQGIAQVAMQKRIQEAERQRAAAQAAAADAANIRRVEQYTGQPMSEYRRSRPASERQFTGHGKSGMGRDPSDRMARGGLASLYG